ncbi:MAG TPA: YkgJ family cysteine cluster protein [Candidatus Thermoplasmatota archaeon]|nr:YkgJ family cysteine cluster protein [Candidatus Thermoplasmatota archaeon]
MPPLAPPPPAALPQIPVKTTVPCIERQCSLCCHDIEMLLTDDDLRRLSRARPGEDFWFKADDGYLQLKTRDGPPARGGAGRPCWFLRDDGLCGVHDMRPEGCRLYPAVWADDLRAAELDADYCPHTDGFLLPPRTGDAVRRLADRLQAERRRRASSEK